MLANHTGKYVYRVIRGTDFRRSDIILLSLGVLGGLDKEKKCIRFKTEEFDFLKSTDIMDNGIESVIWRIQ